MQELKDTADDLGILQGTLSRWLLPFDNSTSVSDQAAAQHRLGSSDLDGLMSHAQRRRLVAEATSLRSLIRVKIADNADLEQASVSVRAIDRFMTRLRKEATHRSLTPYEILQKL